MAKTKVPLRTPPPAKATAQSAANSGEYGQQQPLRSPVDSSRRSHSPPTMDHTAAAAAAAAAAKKKKKKGKAKRLDDDEGDDDEEDDEPVYGASAPLSPPLSHPGSYPHGTSPAHLSHAASAQAQAQADLLATASDLYRRIEADPQGIPDDDAYWTSLPAHLRTFIRNALPLGQFPATGNGHPNDPNSRHASTQAMIAVAQQLAQAAHASQRHLQQYPPGSQPYPSLPFDPAIFADLALNSDVNGNVHAHPHSNGVGNAAAQSPYAHIHYPTNVNPPPTQPPGEPLPAPVVLVNEYGEEAGDYDDEYYSEEESEGLNNSLHHHGLHGNMGNGGHDVSWPTQEHHQQRSAAAAAAAAAMLGTPPSGLAKKNKKKKKKKGGAMGTADVGLPPPPPPPQAVNHHYPHKQTAPTNNHGPNSAALPPPRGTHPPPSSRAAGKQPMTFTSNPPAKTTTANGHAHHAPGSKRPAATTAGSVSSHGTGPGQSAPQQPPRIWSTSTAEERQRIKEFWLRLNEKERRNLVQVEKDAVLRKMKDQQKHSCACAVCGRKRSAIEAELEVLYSAYYEELEQYASHQQQHVKSGGAIPPPPGPGPFPGSVTLDSAGNVVGGNSLTKASAPAQRTRVTAPPKKAPPHPDEDDGYDDELDDDEYDDEYDEEEEEEEEEPLPEAAAPASRKRSAPAPSSTDAFPLGSSLTVKGGILTVADDLLKNDGQKFLEMMEQLADRRMQREEDAAAELDALSDEEDDDEEDDVEDDLDDDDADAEDNGLTDEQRMEEGRRMFQIFAARLFEQRVLSAYREQIAQERQLQLLRELEEEDLAEKEKEAKRQKENQKKKDKKRLQQLKKEEERLKRESEKAAEEAAAREKAEKARQAELKRQEEARLKRDAEKRAKEEERSRKEEEKRKRLEVERAKEAERERLRKEKEEKARLEKEARDAERRAKEEEAKRELERREREERERKAAEAKAKAEATAAAAKEKEQAERDAPQSRGKASAERHSTATRGASTSSPQPPSPTTLRNTSAPSKSPAVVTRSRQMSVPSSPANAAPVMYARPPSSGGAAIPPRPPVGPSSALRNPPSGPSHGSSLPAPPQGLPARPSSKVASFPAAASTSQGGSAHMTTASPVPNSNSGSLTPSASRPSTAKSQPLSIPGPQQPSANFSQIQTATSPSGPPSSTNSNQTASLGVSNVGSSLPSVSPSSAAPRQSGALTPLGPASQSTSLFGRNPYPVPASAVGIAGHPAFAANGGFPASPYETARSPTLSSGLRAGAPGPSNQSGGLDGVQSPSGGVNLAAHGLSSLSLGGAGLVGDPMTPGINHRQQHHMAAVPTSVQTPGPIGPNSSSSPHGRLPSSEELGSLHSSPSQANRAVQRPGPIGRPKPAHDSMDDIVSPRAGSPALPSGILGSSALGGDDELVAPQPRRTSSTVAPIGGGSSLFGFPPAGTSSAIGGSASSAFGTSPWGTSSFASPTPVSTSATSPSFASLGTSLASPSAIGSGSAGLQGGVGSLGSASVVSASGATSAAGAGSDPWAPHSRSGWDRARFAFEQPGGPAGFGSHPSQHQHAPQLHGLAHQPAHGLQHHQQQPGGSIGVGFGGGHNPIGSFGTGPPGAGRSIFDAHLPSVEPNQQRHGPGGF
ncbi:unnamed protein product [Parajaminaea phylloscopi]